MSDRTTGASVTVNETTGEVLDSTAPRRRRRVLTDAERQERDRTLAERATLRRAELAALRSIDPACETEDDPPVVWRAPVRMGGAPNGVLLEMPRVSGRGRRGSQIVIAARSYDGAGPNGGKAHDYVTAFVVFRDGGGYKRRTIGVAIHRAELREVARVLLEYAASLDRGEAAEGDDAGR